MPTCQRKKPTRIHLQLCGAGNPVLERNVKREVRLRSAYPGDPEVEASPLRTRFLADDKELQAKFIFICKVFHIV
ncbi:hypothetical protein L208DRAFT_1414923, partial [Tricholoma matsutake]